MSSPEQPHDPSLASGPLKRPPSPLSQSARWKRQLLDASRPTESQGVSLELSSNRKPESHKANQLGLALQDFLESFGHITVGTSDWRRALVPALSRLIAAVASIKNSSESVKSFLANSECFMANNEDDLATPDLIASLGLSGETQENEEDERLDVVVAQLLEEALFDECAVDLFGRLRDQLDSIESSANDNATEAHAVTLRRRVRSLLGAQTLVVARGWLKVWNWALVLNTVTQRNGLAADDVFDALAIFLDHEHDISRAEMEFKVISRYSDPSHARAYLPVFNESLRKLVAIGLIGETRTEREEVIRHRQRLLAQWSRFVYNCFRIIQHENVYRSGVADVWGNLIGSGVAAMGTGGGLRLESRAPVHGTWKSLLSKLISGRPERTKRSIVNQNTLHTPALSRLFEAAIGTTATSIDSIFRRLLPDEGELLQGVAMLERNGGSVGEGPSLEVTQWIYQHAFFPYHVTVQFILRMSRLLVSKSTRTLNYLLPWLVSAETCLSSLVALQDCRSLPSAADRDDEGSSRADFDEHASVDLPKTFPIFLLRIRCPRFIRTLTAAILIALDEVLLGNPYVTNPSKSRAQTPPHDPMTDASSVWELLTSPRTTSSSGRAPESSLDTPCIPSYLQLIVDLTATLINANSYSLSLAGTLDDIHQDELMSPLSTVDTDQGVYRYIRELRMQRYRDTVFEAYTGANPCQPAHTDRVPPRLTCLPHKSPIGNVSIKVDVLRQALKKILTNPVPPMSWDEGLMEEPVVDDPTPFLDRLDGELASMRDKFTEDADPENGIEDEYRRIHNPIFVRLYQAVLQARAQEPDPLHDDKQVAHASAPESSSLKQNKMLEDESISNAIEEKTTVRDNYLAEGLEWFRLISEVSTGE